MFQTRTMIRIALASLTLGVAAMSALYAQGDVANREPNAAGTHHVTLRPIDVGNAATLLTPRGYFVAYAGVLAKYDPTTLAFINKVELFGAMPAYTPAVKDAAQPSYLAYAKWSYERDRRMAPPALLANGEMLLLVCGDTFLRVNQHTLAIEAQERLFEQQAGPANSMRTGVSLLLHGNQLYLLRGVEVMLLDGTTGKVQGHAPLPDGMMTPIMPNANRSQTNQPNQPNQPTQPAGGKDTTDGKK